MGKLVELALLRGLSGILVLSVFIPVAIMFLGLLMYIVVEIVRELRK